MAVPHRPATNICSLSFLWFTVLGAMASVLPLLAGVQEAGMPAAVAAIAVPMTKFMQECIADGRLPGCGSHHHRQQRNLIDHLPMFGTRPWSNVQSRCLFGGQPSHNSASTAAGHERDIYADRCNLVVVAFKLFQSLTLAARQAQGAIQGAAAQISHDLPTVHKMQEYPSALLKQMKLSGKKTIARISFVPCITVWLDSTRCANKALSHLLLS